MPAEQLDLEVAVEGFSQFMSQMGRMDGAIDKTEKRWGGLSGVAAGVGRSLQTVGTIGLAAIAGGAAVVGGLTVAIGKMALEAAPIEALGLAFAGFGYDQFFDDGVDGVGRLHAIKLAGAVECAYAGKTAFIKIPGFRGSDNLSNR